VVIDECTPIQRALLLHGRAVGSGNVVVICNRFDKCPDEIFEGKWSASRDSAFSLSAVINARGDWRRCHSRRAGTPKIVLFDNLE